MKKLIILLLCLFIVSNCSASLFYPANSDSKESYFNFALHIILSGAGFYYATPYTFVCGVYFLIESSNDLGEIKGYK